VGCLPRNSDDDEVSYWYGNERPSLQQAERRARFMGDSWRFHGVHKWMAYDGGSGEVVGRGGLSRAPMDDDWGQVYAFLPAEPWVRVAHAIRRTIVAHANWVEIGWAIRREFWGRGYAAEIGRAGLTFAFDVLEVQAVVSCTVRHNVRSRAVMKRIGMRYAGSSGGKWSERVSRLTADPKTKLRRSLGNSSRVHGGLVSERLARFPGQSWQQADALPQPVRWTVQRTIFHLFDEPVPGLAGPFRLTNLFPVLTNCTYQPTTSLQARRQPSA
jgi:RimJ/RimL family protein N-acetyltransferase